MRRVFGFEQRFTKADTNCSYAIAREDFFSVNEQHLPEISLARNVLQDL
jgi:hypothetical protein